MGIYDIYVGDTSIWLCKGLANICQEMSFFEACIYITVLSFLIYITVLSEQTYWQFNHSVSKAMQ